MSEIGSANEPKQQVCFVIAPIGEDGTEIRERSDQVLKHIIEPAVGECGYAAIRADKISEPGMITSQVIQHLLEDPLVVADLTGRNANVFYELAVRHAVALPMVQIIQSGEQIPFDVAQSRTIQVDHHNLDSVATCKVELVKQIRSVEKNPQDVDTPITQAVDLRSLRQSDNPLEKSTGEIIEMIKDLRASVFEFMERGRFARVHPGMVEDLMQMLDHTYSILRCPKEEPPSRNQMEEAQGMIRRMDEIVEMLAMESGMPMGMFEEMRMRRRKRR